MPAVMRLGSRSALLATAVVALALAAGAIGYVVAPGNESSAGVTGDSAGALVTLNAEGWTVDGFEYQVTVLAETGIESVALISGGSELARIDADGRHVLRVAMHANSADPAHAVATLEDGRTASSRPVSTSDSFEVAAGGDTGAIRPRSGDHVPVPIVLSPNRLQSIPSAGSGDLVMANRRTESPERSSGIQVESGVSWTGPGQLRGGILHIDDPEVSRVFFYITDDGEIWHRVPRAAGTSLPLANSRVDVTGELPVLEGTDLQLEIWRDDDIDTAMLGVATASSQTPWEQASFTGQVGFLGRVDLDLISREGTNEQAVKTLWLDQDEWSPIDLKWGTDLPNVTHVVWHAYTFRPTDEGTPTDISAASVGWANRSNDGRFTFVPPGTVSPDGTTVESAETGQSFLDYQLVLGQGEPGAVDTTLPQDLKLALAGIDVAPETPRSWYLRAFAFNAEGWVGVASDVVGVHLGKPPALKKPPPQGGYDIKVNVAAPAPVNPAYRLCWVVVGVDEAAKAAHLSNALAHDPDEWFRASIHYAYLDAIRAKYGDTLCQNACYKDLNVQWPEGTAENWLDDWLGGGLKGAFPPGCNSSASSCADTLGSVAGGLCDAVLVGGGALVTLLVDGYTVLEQTYDEIKAEVVTFATQYSGCDALLDDDLCDTAAKIALDAALASAGIPPSMPSIEEIENSAKGDLKATLVELANKHVGSVCDVAEVGKEISGKLKSCDDLADELVEEAVALAKNLARADARNAYGMPFPPGVQVKPDPRGNALPLHVQLAITPEPGTTPGPTCDVEVVASIAFTPHPTGLPGNAFFDVTWPPLSFGVGSESWFVADDTFTDWYDAATVRFPVPASAQQTVTLDVLLEAPVGPSGRYSWGSTAFSEWAVWEVPRDVLVLRSGAQVTVVAYASCANGDIATTMVALSA